MCWSFQTGDNCNENSHLGILAVFYIHVVKISFHSANQQSWKTQSVTIVPIQPCHEIMAFLSSVNSFLKRACVAIQWGYMSDFWSDSSSTSILHVCEQRRLWRDCADAQARLCLRCHLCDKYHNLMSWLNYQFRYPYCNANIHTVFINHIILHFYKPHHLVPKVSIKTRMLANGKWCNVIPTVYCTTYVSNSLILIQVTVSLHSGVNQKWILLVISSHIKVIVRKIFQSFQTSSTPSFYTKQV